MTLAHGVNYQLTVSGAVTLGAAGIMTQGTGTWTFGSYTQNGASSVFTQAGFVQVNGAVSVSLGTLTGNGGTSMFNVTGSFTKTGGTINSVNLKMLTDGTTINLDAPMGFTGIHIFGNVGLQQTAWMSILEINTGKTLTIASGRQASLVSPGPFTNLGTVAGPGNIAFDFYTADWKFRLLLRHTCRANVYPGRA